MAMFELNWASFEPRPGVVCASYLATMRSYLRAYQTAGQRVTLGLGLQNPPSWVFSLPGSTYVDQNGGVSTQAGFVFSQAVRQAAASYLSLVAAALPLSACWAIRLTSGGDGEMLYPPDGTYWAFSPAALTGTGLADGMAPNPYPTWRPGRPGLAPAQIDRWVNWYVGGLASVTSWQMRTLSRLGFAGYYQVVTPGSGTRPGDLAEDEQQNLLDDETTCVGAVWDRYYAMLPDKTKVMAYISSVADRSGDDDCGQAADTRLPLASAEMDSWSATRWISRIAREHDGERPAPGPLVRVHRLLLGARRPPVGRHDPLRAVRRHDRAGGGGVTTDRLARLIAEMDGAGSAVMVMSPHLDDAVLSCGALLAHLAARHLITVVTVFTAAAPPPWSLPARRQLRALGRVDPGDFFRRGRRGPAYPTFRFDAARGRVASCDAGLAAEVSARAGEIARASQAHVVFAPLGVGRHVDHLITRRAARELGREIRIVYYSDFPYSQTAGPEPGFIRDAGLVPHPWLCGRAENASRIAGYRTQFAGLFGDGPVPTRPEIYWVAANDSATVT